MYTVVSEGDQQNISVHFLKDDENNELELVYKIKAVYLSRERQILGRFELIRREQVPSQVEKSDGKILSESYV